MNPVKPLMIDKQQFQQQMEQYLHVHYQVNPSQATTRQVYEAVSSIGMQQLSECWLQSREKQASARRGYYLSAEFLMGRAVTNNLMSLGMLESATEALKELGIDISCFEEIEDAALGNGGLGRLAACFLDAAATHNIPLDGYGIRYRYGLFEQTIVDGFQQERADDWHADSDPWSVRREDLAVNVEFADQAVKAVPYDMPIVGYGGEQINTLRLWQSEPRCPFDFKLFNDQKYDDAVKERNDAERISSVLYPNDSTDEGKKLRLKQQYFFSSASLKDIIRGYKAVYGSDFSKFVSLYAIQLNDTHPVISIPELIRILVDNEGIAFLQAFEMARQVFHYTNHTIMAEALEKWSVPLMREVLPRIYEIIEQINEHLIREFTQKAIPVRQLRSMRIVADGMIHMAHLAIYASSHTNGVAQLHTEILKNQALHDWYEIYPERFLNKTNGITQRRWLRLCNPELSALLTELLGDDRWVKDLTALKELERYAEDTAVLERFMGIKLQKKQTLSAYMEKQDGVTIDPSFLFDIQVKRLHEYKRQLLNAFSIVDLYFRLKEGKLTDFAPTAFIFGAKAAPGYYRAKGIIKYIGEIAKLVNNDPAVNGLMRVVFVANYNVSYGEKLFPAADVSEQISTAGTEASGTGNMKFMLNGAVTLGTYDGANVEIVQRAGEENNYIFGARVEELDQIKDSYNPKALYQKDDNIRRVLDTLIDGTFDDGETGMFRELYNALLDGASWHKADHYFLLHDLPDYVQTKIRVNSDYRDRVSFARKCWINLCNAGHFSADRTILEYAKEIWML